MHCSMNFSDEENALWKKHGDESREHIAKLLSIESNMLQENFLPYLVYAEDGQRRIDELLGKLKAWNGEDSKLYKDFCVKAGL